MNARETITFYHHHGNLPLTHVNLIKDFVVYLYFFSRFLTDYTVLNLFVDLILLDDTRRTFIVLNVLCAPSYIRRVILEYISIPQWTCSFK